MPRHRLTRAQRRISAAALALVGVLLWVAAATLHLTAAPDRDVSLAHITMHLVGVVTGGAVLTGAIALIASG